MEEISFHSCRALRLFAVNLMVLVLAASTSSQVTQTASADGSVNFEWTTPSGIQSSFEIGSPCSHRPRCSPHARAHVVRHDNRSAGDRSHEDCCSLPIPSRSPDPVDIASGAFYHREIDHSLAGFLDMSVLLERHYHSSNESSSVFGNNWDSPAFQRFAHIPVSEYASSDGVLAVYYDGAMNSGVPYVFRQIEVNGSSEVITYEPGEGSGFLLRSYNPSGGLIDYLIAEDAVGRSYRFDYEMNLYGANWYRISSISDAYQNETRFSYNQDGQLERITSCLGQFLDFDYVAQGNNTGRVKEIRDSEGRVYTYTYNPEGDLVRVDAPAPNAGAPRPATSYGYDAASRLVTLTIPGQVAPFLTNEFDSEGRVYEQRGALPDQVTSLDYSAFPVVLVTDPEGTAIEYEIDVAGENQFSRVSVLSATAGIGPFTSTYTYHPDGKLATATGPDGVRFEYTYDSQSNDARERHNLLIRTMVASDGVDELVEKWGFEAGSSLVEWYMDAAAVSGTGGAFDAQKALQYEYGQPYRLTRVLSPLSTKGATAGLQGSIENLYDGMGRRIERVDATGEVRTYDYDDTARTQLQPTTVTHHSAEGPNSIYQFTWDEDYNLQLSTHPSGATLVYERNLLGQVERVTRRGSDNQIVAMHEVQYNDALEVEEERELIDTAPDLWFIRSFEYFADGSIWRVTDAKGLPEEVTHEYEYFADGKLRIYRDPAGFEIESEYRDTGEIESQVWRSVDGSENGRRDYAYNGLRQLEEVSDGAGGVRRYVYDKFARSVFVEDVGETGVAIDFGPGGEPTSVREYDDGQLFSQLDMSRDELGNWFQLTGKSVDESGQLSGSADDSAFEINYDVAGRVRGLSRNARAIATIDYSDRGNVSQVTSSDDDRIEYEATGGWFVDAVTRSLHHGQVQEESEEQLLVSDFDGAGRPRQVTLGPLSAQLTYGLQGLITGQEWSDGHVISNEYDAFGRLTESVDVFTELNGSSSTETHSFTYLPDGRPLSFTIAPSGGQSRGVTFDYDARGELSAIQYTDGGGLEILGRDAHRRPSLLEVNDAVSIAITRDRFGEAASVTMQSGSPDLALTSLTIDRSPTGAHSYIRDDIATVAVSSKEGGALSELTMDQSSATEIGEVIYERMDGGAVITELLTSRLNSVSLDFLERTFDESSETSIMRWSDVGTGLFDDPMVISRTGLHAREFSLAGQAIASFNYDPVAGSHTVFVTGLNGVAVDREIRLDEGGDVIAVIDGAYQEYGTTASEPAVAFTYKRNRSELSTVISGLQEVDLVSYPAVSGSGGVVLTRDSNWNWTSIQPFANPAMPWAGFVYSPIDDRVLTSGLAAFSHNSLGAIEAGPALTSMTYDGLGLLKSGVVDGEAVALDYDGRGRLVRYQDGAVETSLLWFGDRVVASESRDATGTIALWALAYTGEQPMPVMARDLLLDEQYLLIPDATGGVREFISEQGDVVALIGRNLLGSRVQLTDTRVGSKSDLTHFPLGHQNGIAVGGSGRLTLMAQRIYDAEIGRFIQRDPFPYPDGVGNRYQKTALNPFRLDASGLGDPGESTDTKAAWTHYGISLFAAEEAGVEELAVALAYNTWKVDHGPKVANLRLFGGERAVRNNIAFHALHESDRVVHAMVRFHLRRAIRTKNVAKISDGLHFIQDAVFHRRSDGSRFGSNWGHFWASVFSRIGVSDSGDVPAPSMGGFGRAAETSGGIQEKWLALDAQGFATDVTMENVAPEWAPLQQQRVNLAQRLSTEYLKAVFEVVDPSEVWAHTSAAAGAPWWQRRTYLIPRQPSTSVFTDLSTTDLTSIGSASGATGGKGPGAGGSASGVGPAEPSPAGGSGASQCLGVKGTSCKGTSFKAAPKESPLPTPRNAGAPADTLTPFCHGPDGQPIYNPHQCVISTAGRPHPTRGKWRRK